MVVEGWCLIGKKKTNTEISGGEGQFLEIYDLMRGAI